jgi:hypothetical protein
MPTTKGTGYETTLSGETAGAIGNIVDINIPGYEYEMIDVSDMDSDDNFQEFVAAAADAGQVTVEINYTDDNFATVYAAGGVSDTFTITTPSGGTCVFTGIGQSLSSQQPHRAKATISWTIKVSGKPAFTAAT